MEGLMNTLGISEALLRQKLECRVPFTLDELHLIAGVLGIDLSEFFRDETTK